MSLMLRNAWVLATTAALLGGCGLVQSVGDGTRSMASAVFHKQVKTLLLDFDGRVVMNSGGTDMHALSVPTLVRVYQLRDNVVGQRATYDLLLSDARGVLGATLLDERTLVVRPGGGATLNVPLEKEAGFVVVIALFREPDKLGDSWRLALARDDLDPDRPRVIEVAGNRLTLRPRSGD